MNSKSFFDHTRFPLIVFIASVLLASCSSAPELSSKWKQADISVDGIDNEWQQNLNYFEKEKLAVGIKNDAENLYFSIKSIDRETQMKIIRGGMTVWFDSSGGSKNIFGIHFPLGFAAMGFAGTSANHIRGSREELNETNDSRALDDKFSTMLQNIEIIGPGPVDKQELPVSASFRTYGIQVALRDTMGTLFYEVVVPLRMTKLKPLAIGSDTGRVIGIGIITESTKRPQAARMAEESAPNGGAGSLGGMGGGTMGGRPGGGGRRGGGAGQNQDSNSPIEFWMKVKVATEK